MAIQTDVPEPTSEQVERFWSKVETRDDGCWEWLGSTVRGYGQFGLIDGRMVKAHRLAYLLYHGAQPGGLVLHRCDNRRCVRREHIYAGSHADNSSDMTSRDRQASGARNGRARLSEADVVAIRERLKAGATQRELSRDYAVHHNTIWWISKGLHWK